ncbi:PAS domain S-box protein [Exiguobacterium sp. s16]|jgi:diguanylate cyclase (GGDEF)-like protein/PAS domain S-box-containing protein|uniref:PAS domain S-box protein n=2 Tax=unclassified Exiguobacterium TaxID=2644629 RepID=UPI002036D9B7|nr:PAS domain S-box protein [Exiguobacterium sp. s16]
MMHADQTIQHYSSVLLRTFDKISDFVFFMEVDGSTYRYIFVNEPGKQAIGWTDADIGKRVEDMVPPETAALVTRHYEEAVRERKSIVFEDYRLAEPSYSVQPVSHEIQLPVHYYESEVTPVFDEAGVCTHVISVVREVTERKRRELELSILKDQHESLRRYSPHGIFVLDDAFRVQSINPAATQITGYGEDDLLGESFLAWLPESERMLVDDGLRFALSGTPHKYGITALQKTGDFLDLAILNIPIEVGGRITGLFAIIIDHTPEKNAERATQESERRYRQLIETIPEGIIVHKDGVILYANALALETIGATNIERESIFKFVASEFHETTKARLQALRQGDPVQDTEIVLLTPGGRRLHMDIGSLLIDYEGTTAVMTLLRDVTEKREMERALHQSETQYRLITENMSDLVCILERDGQVRYASPSHKTVLGYAPELYEGKNTLDFIHPNDVESARRQLDTMTASSEPLTLEFRHLHQDGRWIWLETKIQAIYDDVGQLLHYLTVTREIMKRKVLEKQLKHLAYHDTLTDLPNRRYFLAYLEETLVRLDEGDESLAVLSLDIDCFKQINDTLGHDIGDELLRQFSARLTDVLRNQDVIARFGGDEFSVLIRYTESDAPRRVAEKLVTALQLPWLIEGHTFVTTSSVGVAPYRPGMSTKQLLKHADLALYEAKANGRNQYVVFKDRS